ncbi:MAG UNVERIFIED_CONTAM: hypothetical protein LVR18_14475 [Planctomycetaceae bacterium]
MTSEDQEVKILDRFLEYLPQDFIGRLEDCSEGPLPGGASGSANQASKCYVVGGAPPERPDGTQGPKGPYIVLSAEGELMIGGVFRVEGDFYFELNATPEMFVTAKGSLSIAPFGAIAVSGTLNISPAGVYGGLQLGASLNLGPLTIFGAAQLQFNTTGEDREITRYKFDFPNRRVTTELEDVTIPFGSLRLDVAGYLGIAGSFELKGSFQLENTPELLTVHVDASFEAFGANMLSVNGDAIIVKQGNSGFVADLAASVEAPLEVDGVFELKADFNLRMNTRGGTGTDQYDRNIERGSYYVDWTGELVLLSLLKLQGSGVIEYAAGVFMMDVSVAMEVVGNRVEARGAFTSEGEFLLKFGASMMIGAPGFGVQGTASFEISRIDDNGVGRGGDENYVVNVTGFIGGRVELFGITLASASITFGLEGSTGRVYITPKVTLNLLFVTIELSTTFNLFYIKIPPNVFLAGNEDDTTGTAFRGGVLYLNMGSRAQFRNESNDEKNEGFIIQHINPHPEIPGDAVRVRAFGHSRSFYGVTGIVANGGDGYDYITIQPGVNVPVTLTGGEFRDTLVYSGSGGCGHRRWPR